MTRRPTQRAIWLVSLITLATSLTLADASEFRSFTRQQQVAASDLIVVGRVVDTRSAWDPAGSTIHTTAQVVVEEVWKGSADSDGLVVRTPGGVIDNVAMRVDGAATFTSGERVVLFLREEDDGVYAPWGMRFGVYEIFGSAEDSFALGALPPASANAQRYRHVSLTVPELHDDVMAALEGEGR